MLLRVALWSLLVLEALIEPGVHGFECKKQASSQEEEGSCRCDFSFLPSYQYDIYCPHVRAQDSKIHIELKENEGIVIKCSR